MNKNNLASLFTTVKQELFLANEDRRHPFRLCTLATNEDHPALRTVVKRETTEELTNFFYTDGRSAKVKHIENDPRTSLLFYDSSTKLQVTMQANTEIINGGPIYEKHKQIAMLHPQDYTSELPPGSKIDIDHEKTTTETHFCLLACTPISIQILQLGKEKHLRAEYYREDGWAGQWLVP